MSNNAIIRVHSRFPRQLFRVNDGWRISLRPQSLRNPWIRHEIAVPVAEEGQPLRDGPVTPKALLPGYKGPNGANMRPNTPYLQHLVGHEFKGQNNGADIMVYAVDEGTPIPDDLILVHEGVGREDYSLQPARDMTLGELNQSITRFLQANGALMTKAQFLQAYPKATAARGMLPKRWMAKEKKEWSPVDK